MTDTTKLPIDPRTKEPLPPRAQPGYYPGFSTLGQADFWDEATRAVVLKRVNEPPAIRFFTLDEATILAAVCDRIMPQDDRDEAHRIPIVNGIDARLHANRTDGYRYEHMPPDREAHRLGLQAIDQIAQHLCGQSFVALGPIDQDRVLETLHDAKPPAAKEIWDKMPVTRYWMLLVQDVVEQYYAHPYAWDEIGFGGPAYPRAYVRLENGQPEPWEVAEKRYEWEAPPSTLSGTAKPLPEHGDRTASPGQGGTH